MEKHAATEIPLSLPNKQKCTNKCKKHLSYLCETCEVNLALASRTVGSAWNTALCNDEHKAR
jgi:hypothetical protein